ncbi:MAG: hypothetical protein KC464_16530, partial [Myxococcales bacterium]|nr:hypothetical protein [Myxococcales bacterium]
LTEMITRGATTDAVILGVGIDVATRRAELPAELAAIATSIAEEAGAAPTPAALADALCAELEGWLERYVAGGVAAIAGAWQDRAGLGAGDPPAVEIGGRTGWALGLDHDGALRVALDGGEVTRVVAGDVVERTP